MGSRSVEKGTAAVRDVQASTKLKGAVSLQQLDVTDEASISTAAQDVARSFGRIDVLIQNAAVAGLESRLGSPMKHVTEVLAANTVGPLVVTEAFKSLLLKSDHARLIFVSSGLGSITQKCDDSAPFSGGLMPGMAPDTPPLIADATAYRVSKAGLDMVAAHYHQELKGKGVKVHVMCPGFVHTNLRRDKEPMPGTLPPETSGRTMLTILEGKRDDHVGEFVHNNGHEGVYPW